MIGWAIETLVATTGLMLLVLAIRGPVRRTFGPHIAYALWLVPLLRLVLPPLPGDWQLSRLLQPLVREAQDAPGVVFGAHNPETLPGGVVDQVILNASFDVAGASGGVALVPPSAVEGGPNLLLLLGLAWAVGAALFLLYHLISHSLFCQRLLARARVDHRVAAGRVRVIETDAAHGPLAFGIWRKYVAFPRDFHERYDDVERDLALAHELGHHVRGDLIANWVALVVLAIHWFNPVAWRAFRAFRADQEMACDALVLAGREKALRHAYGRAIVKSAHGGAVSAACHLHTINELKGRLRMLSKTNKPSPARFAAGTAGTLALAIAGLGLTASGTQAAETIKATVERTVGVTLGGMQDAPPVPPEAPAAPSAEVEAQSAPVAPEVPEPALDGARFAYRIVEGDNGRGHRVIVRSKVPGETGNFQVSVAGDGQDGPEVVERRCGLQGDASRAVTVTTRSGDRQMVTICTDRIEALEAEAEALAERAEAHAERAEEHARTMVRVRQDERRMRAHDERMRAEAAAIGVDAERIRTLAMAHAREGMRVARVQIAASPNIPAEAKAEALAEIDEAIAELEAEARDTDD